MGKAILPAPPRSCQGEVASGAVCRLRSKGQPGIPRGLGHLAGQAFQMSPAWAGCESNFLGSGKPCLLWAPAALYPFPSKFPMLRHPRFVNMCGVKWNQDPGCPHASPQSAPHKMKTPHGLEEPSKAGWVLREGNVSPKPTSSSRHFSLLEPPLALHTSKTKSTLTPGSTAHRGLSPPQNSPSFSKLRGHLLQEAFLASPTPRH